jgi:hypothetical protein
VTLELTKEQAETVYVALQLGRLQFSLRSIEESPSAAADHVEHRTATWAGDVSPALRQMPHTPLQVRLCKALQALLRAPFGGRPVLFNDVPAEKAANLYCFTTEAARRGL